MLTKGHDAIHAINNSMSSIWIFRERRSGSTAFIDYLSLRLNRKNIFVSNEERLKNVNLKNKIITTHNFELLENMERYDDPVIIKVTRRNAFEQFLSDFVAYTINNNKVDKDLVYNYYKNQTNDEKIFDIKPRLVPKQFFDTWKNRYIHNNHLWTVHSSKFKNDTIYYEDMFNNIDISILNLTDCNILKDSTTIKLPEYKKRLILNYEEVKVWTDSIK